MLSVHKTYEASTNPLTEENLENMQKLLAAEYSNTEASFFVPRLFSIIEVSEENATMNLNFHLTSKTNYDSKMYAVLQNISINELKEFKYESFRNAERCIGFQLAIGRKFITWPAVNIGEVLESGKGKFCIDSTGDIVHMSCEGR